MIPIGNGIQLVWITALHCDQSTTPALGSSLTLYMSGKLFTSRVGALLNKPFLSKKFRLLVCVMLTNYKYVLGT